MPNLQLQKPSRSSKDRRKALKEDWICGNKVT